MGIYFYPKKTQKVVFAKKLSRKYCLRKALSSCEKVPTDQQKANVGPVALDCQPKIEQLFVGAKGNISQDDFERKLI